MKEQRAGISDLEGNGKKTPVFYLDKKAVKGKG